MASFELVKQNKDVMKSFPLLILLFSSCLGLAQIPGNGQVKTRTQSLGMFSILKIEFPAQVEVVCQSLPHLEITTDANLFSFIKVDAYGSALRMYTTDELVPSKDIEIKIGTAFLHELETGFNGEYWVKAIDGPKFKLKNIAATATLEGETGELRIMSETGKTDATQLIYNKAYVNVWDQGEIRLGGGELLEATASKKGRVIYQGKPSYLKANQKSGGKVLAAHEAGESTPALVYFDLSLRNNSGKKVDLFIKGPPRHPFSYGAPIQAFQKRKEHFPVGTKIYLDKPIGKVLLLKITEADKGQTVNLFDKEEY